jgi:RNA polymerase sigma factor (sigma-70 family)
MRDTPSPDHQQLDLAYQKDKPLLLARMKAAGRTLQEAEDLVHDVYVEAWSRLPFAGIRNVSAWINTLFTRRLIDLWRSERRKLVHPEVAEETWQEILADVGLNPLDGFVREALVDALNDALAALPKAQRQVVEAQVFEGLTFREIAEQTGEDLETLKARKRYALARLSRALRHWIEE